MCQGSDIAMSFGVGCRCGSDLALLWPWLRTKARAQIPPLAWELSYAMAVALKKKKKKNQQQIVAIDNHYQVKKH